MRPESRQLTFVEYKLLHPPLDRFENSEVAEFYALVHPLHPFESCVLRGDSGGVIETEGWVTIDINRDSFSYSERVRDDFSIVRKRAVDVLDLAMAKFQIPVFVVRSITMRQVWPAPDEGDMAQRLRNTLSLKPDHYEALGEDVGAGVHFVGTLHEDDDDALHWHLELDPFLPEETTLWVQLRAYFADPQTTADGLGEKLDSTRNFLEDNVTRFVLGLLSPPEPEATEEDE
jgi:hypothetical protein